VGRPPFVPSSAVLSGAYRPALGPSKGERNALFNGLLAGSDRKGLTRRAARDGRLQTTAGPKAVDSLS